MLPGRNRPAPSAFPACAEAPAANCGPTDRNKHNASRFRHDHPHRLRRQRRDRLPEIRRDRVEVEAVYRTIVIEIRVDPEFTGGAEIARTEISPLSGVITGIAILFIVVIALAGLGLVVVKALGESPWGTFTVGFTIPLALIALLANYTAIQRLRSSYNYLQELDRKESAGK